ncbi:hypothetical protein JTE90_004673 [Oedothorax gibbosus]|uniref:Uncharacterized protein n=1 Tax=Oedothorax gibbosus TaxID=931172 RepID=A0AAV6UAI2_9ARAC|nr:hypothetical protein JTE90_004673 [Oedothorax gibbosus]
MERSFQSFGCYPQSTSYLLNNNISICGNIKVPTPEIKEGCLRECADACTALLMIEIAKAKKKVGTLQWIVDFKGKEEAASLAMEARSIEPEQHPPTLKPSQNKSSALELEEKLPFPSLTTTEKSQQRSPD